mgnify:FL=1
MIPLWTGSCYGKGYHEKAETIQRGQLLLLFISIGLWAIVLYSFRVAFFGNPLWQLLQETDPGVIEGAEDLTQSGGASATTDEVAFLRRFSRLTLLELGLFLLEVFLLIYLWVSGTLAWLAAGLLAKDLVLVGVSAFLARGRGSDGVFTSLLKLPKPFVWTDRASALVSCIGFLVLFLAVNDLWLM